MSKTMILCLIDVLVWLFVVKGVSFKPAEKSTFKTDKDLESEGANYLTGNPSGQGTVTESAVELTDKNGRKYKVSKYLYG